MKKGKDGGVVPPAELLAENQPFSAAFRKKRKTVLVCKSVVTALFLLTLLLMLFLPATRQKYSVVNTQGEEIWSRTYDYSVVQGVSGAVSYFTAFNKAPSENGQPLGTEEEEAAAIRKNMPSAFERAGYLQSWLTFEAASVEDFARMSGSGDQNSIYDLSAANLAEQLEIFIGEIETANLRGANKFIALHNARGYSAEGASEEEQKLLDEAMKAWFDENASVYLTADYEWSPELSEAINKMDGFATTDENGVYYLYKRSGAWEGSTWKMDGGELQRRGGTGVAMAFVFDVAAFVFLIVGAIQFVLLAVSLGKTLRKGESASMKRITRGYGCGVGAFAVFAIGFSIGSTIDKVKNMVHVLFPQVFALNVSAVICIVFAALVIAAIIVYNQNLKKMQNLIDEWVQSKLK